MDAQQQAQIMTDTAYRLIDMVQRRMNDRVKMLGELNLTPMDQLPDQVKQLREIEAIKLRSVIQEQADLIDTMKLLFPRIPPEPPKQIDNASDRKE